MKRALRSRHGWSVTIDDDSTFALRSDSIERNATITCLLRPTRSEVKILYRGYRRDENTIGLSCLGYQKQTTATETSLNFTIPIFTKGESVWSIWSISQVSSLLFHGQPILLNHGVYSALLEYVKKGEDFRKRYNQNAERWKK